MKRFFSFFLVVAVLSIATPFAAPAPVRAAALAEDHTVLYYLIEMQRRTRRSCDGVAMPEASSLMPSATLRSLAQASSASGRQAVGKDGDPLFTAFCVGSTPQKAVDNLLASQCQAVMSPGWRYIGAYGESGNWTVVMAARDPDQWTPAEPGQTDGHASGQTDVRSERSQPGSAGASTPGTLSAADLPGAQAAHGTGPDTAKNEPRDPAKPVAVREIEIDALGRPILPSGTPPALTPPSLPAPSSPPTDASPGPDTSRGEPVRPASPVPVGTIEVDAFGRPILPPQSDPRVVPPSQGAPAAPSAPAAPQGASGVTPLSDMRASPPSTLYAMNQIPGDAPAAQASPVGQAGAGASRVALSQQSPSQTASGQGRMVVGTAPVRVAHEEPDPMVMLGLVNEVRAKGAVCAEATMPPAPALAPDAQLMEAARQHAGDMAARNFFSSTSPESVTLGQRLSRLGYLWSFLAENIARGVPSPGKTLESWLAGREPCRTLMDPQFTQAGAGFATQGSVWVLTLATPSAEGDGLRLR